MADLTDILEQAFVHDVKLASKVDACMERCGAEDQPRPVKEQFNESMVDYVYPCKSEDENLIRDISWPKCSTPASTINFLITLSVVPSLECLQCLAGTSFGSMVLLAERQQGIAPGICATGYTDCGSCCDINADCTCDQQCGANQGTPELYYSNELGCSYSPVNLALSCSVVPDEEILERGARADADTSACTPAHPPAPIHTSTRCRTMH